jgi:hypothetical protein
MAAAASLRTPQELYYDVIPDAAKGLSRWRLI